MYFRDASSRAHYNPDSAAAALESCTHTSPAERRNAGKQSEQGTSARLLYQQNATGQQAAMLAQRLWQTGRGSYVYVVSSLFVLKSGYSASMFASGARIGALLHSKSLVSNAFARAFFSPAALV